MALGEVNGRRRELTKPSKSCLDNARLTLEPAAMRDLNEYHRSAQLPATLENLVSGLPDSTAAEVREGLATAFGEADVGILSRIQKSLIPVGGNDTWALPEIQARAVKAALTQAGVVGTLVASAGSTTTLATLGSLASVVATLAFTAIAGFHARAELSLQQAAVLRVLRKAPKGAGWDVAEILSYLPQGDLTTQDVEAIIGELKGMFDASGSPVTWTIHEQDGRHWSAGV